MNDRPIRRRIPTELEPMPRHSKRIAARGHEPAFHFKAQEGDPFTDFPNGIGAYLADCRERGLTFDEAWTNDLNRAARDAGFSWKQQPFAVEASVPFMLRHLRAAYEGRDTMRYCERDCVYLAVDHGTLCIAHAMEEREVA
jgi:hypothetical protein